LSHGVMKLVCCIGLIYLVEIVSDQITSVWNMILESNITLCSFYDAVIVTRIIAKIWCIGFALRWMALFCSPNHCQKMMYWICMNNFYMIILLYNLIVCVDQLSFLVKKTKFRQKFDSGKKIGSNRKPYYTTNLNK
jgi:hypothetical protein